MNQELKITFLNVGKADAIVLHTPRSTMMVDTGTKAGASSLVGTLSRMGLRRIDFLVLTHFDQDHVGGVSQILPRFPVSHVLTTYEYRESEEVGEYHAAMAQARITPELISSRTSFSFDGVRYQITPPDQTFYTEDTSNNSSLVLKVIDGSVSFLLPGDIRQERILELLRDNAAIEADVLKLPHHGAHVDATDKLISVVSPRYAVITSSDLQRESPLTMAALSKVGVKVLRTREGTVQIRTDGRNIFTKQFDDRQAPVFL